MLSVIEWLLNDDFTAIYNSSFFFCFILIYNIKFLNFKGLLHLKTLRGYALQDIITEVSRFVQLSK